MKVIACILVALFVMMSFAPMAVARENGGVFGFVVGCCFGVRAAGAYNEGKDLHWREWGLIIPFVGWVVAVLNGIDGANGMTTSDFAKQFGSHYY